MSLDDPTLDNRDYPDDPPPILGTWNRVYIAVLIYLALTILGFWIFSVVFTP
jgi:hypothetical protein